MFTVLTRRGEPMNRQHSFTQAYAAARAEAIRRGEPVRFVVTGGQRYEVPASGNGWMRVASVAA